MGILATDDLGFSGALIPDDFDPCFITDDPGLAEAALAGGGGGFFFFEQNTTINGINKTIKNAKINISIQTSKTSLTAAFWFDDDFKLKEWMWKRKW